MAAAAEFDFETAVTWTATRKSYGEMRTITIGFIAHRLHVLVHHARPKVASYPLRKANRKESAAYYGKK
jgi:uncharacterized DUF497 family protein